MNFALNFTFNYQQDILQVSARIEQNVDFQEQLSRARSHLHLLFPETIHFEEMQYQTTSEANFSIWNTPFGRF